MAKLNPADRRSAPNASYEEIRDKLIPEAIERADKARAVQNWAEAESALVTLSNLPRSLIRRNEEDRDEALVPLGEIKRDQVVATAKLRYAKVTNARRSGDLVWAKVDEISKTAVILTSDVTRYNSDYVAKKMGTEFKVENEDRKLRIVH